MSVNLLTIPNNGIDIYVSEITPAQGVNLLTPQVLPSYPATTNQLSYFKGWVQNFGVAWSDVPLTQITTVNVWFQEEGGVVTFQFEQISMGQIPAPRTAKPQLMTKFPLPISTYYETLTGANGGGAFLPFVLEVLNDGTVTIGTSVNGTFANADGVNAFNSFSGHYFIAP